ncbi:cytochrome c [Phreatobacter aquaticus]|uniref:Cytochrome c n=1 Tax=Phreatobacter aquaticus TaxID=2570229 RepID=A0A4D7QFF1_9HYPH|nr:cytochrome c [Phreatobacter aquaticus]QCK86660.1 cytochrome c [Phreatobacter aquaticus]
MVRFGALALVFLALSPPAEASDRRHRQNALIERGRTLVRENCSRCHAIDRTGTSTFQGAPVFRELWRRYPVDVLEEALAEGFSAGHPAMPEFTFSGEGAAAIVAYLISIQTRPLPRPR